MSVYILRDRFFGPFALSLIETKGKMGINQGFTQVQATVYKMTFHALPDSYYIEDVLNSDAAGEAPRLELFSAAGYNGNPGGRGAKNLMRVGSHQGKDIMAWDEFLKIAIATNANLEEVNRPPVPKQGMTLKSIVFRLGALEGAGPYEARNVARAWSLTDAQFKEEDALDALILAKGAAAAAHGIGAENPLASKNGGTATHEAPPVIVALKARPKAEEPKPKEEPKAEEGPPKSEEGKAAEPSKAEEPKAEDAGALHAAAAAAAAPKADKKGNR